MTNSVSNGAKRLLGSVFNIPFDTSGEIRKVEHHLDEIRAVKAMTETPGWGIVRGALESRIRQYGDRIIELSKKPHENELELARCHAGRIEAQNLINIVETILSQKSLKERELRVLYEAARKAELVTTDIPR